jgi:hypothetical protein
MTALDAIILAAAGISLVVSITAYLRGTPAQIRDLAEHASRTATRACDDFAAFRSQATTILHAIEEERERTERAAARATARDYRMKKRIDEQDGIGEDQGGGREQDLLTLRKKAGIL